MCMKNKIAFISDIHGNYEALKVVLNYLDINNINTIYSLGDVVGYYCQVNEVCEELQKRDIPNIFGNHDWYLAGGGKCPRSKSANYLIEFQKKIISKDNLNWLSKSRLFYNFKNIRAVHGGWENPIDEYMHDIDEKYFDKLDGSIFLSGHTHIPCIREFQNGKIYCNPGSVGQPRDNNPHTSFALLADNKFEIVRLDYDYEPLFKEMREYGIDDYYYGCLKYGSPRLRNL